MLNFSPLRRASDTVFCIPIATPLSLCIKGLLTLCVCIPIDFYGEGPLKDENGMCVPHEPNKHEMMVQDALVILSHVVSLILTFDQHIKAFLTKKGTRSAEGTDS